MISKCISEMEDAPGRGPTVAKMVKIAESTYTAWAIVAGFSILWHYHIEQAVPRPYLVRRPAYISLTVLVANLALRMNSSTFSKRSCISRVDSRNGIQRSPRRQDCECILLVTGLRSLWTNFESYLVSLAYLGFLSVSRIIDQVHVADLRRTNVAAAGLLPFHVWFVIHEIVHKYNGTKVDDVALPFLWSMAELNHAILNICIFPPLFFFYGLYYTDVWSVLSVLTTIQFHQRRWRKLMVAAAIASLFFRQTNIFWVAIYLGGSEIIRQLHRGRPGVDYPATETVLDVVAGSWQHSCIYDPLVHQASFEGTSRAATNVSVTDECTQTILNVHCPLSQHRSLASSISSPF